MALKPNRDGVGPSGPVGGPKEGTPKGGLQLSSSSHYV